MDFETYFIGLFYKEIIAELIMKWLLHFGRKIYVEVVVDSWTNSQLLTEIERSKNLNEMSAAFW